MKLSQPESYYKDLFAQMDQGYCIMEVRLDEKGNVADLIAIEINRAWEEKTGILAPIGRPVSELLPNFEEHWLPYFDCVFKTGTPLRSENYIQDLDRWFSVYYSLVGGPESRLVAAFFDDITEHKRVEKALRESKEKYRSEAARLQATLKGMNDAVYIGDTSGITLANQAALDQLGYTNYEELNKNIGILAEEIETRDAISQEVITAERQAFARALHGEHVVQNVKVTHIKNGEERIVRTAASPVILDGNTIAAVAINTDVTEQWKLAETLRESEEKYRTIFESIDEGFCIYELIYDEEGKPVDLKWVEVNPAYEKQTGLKDVLGKRHSDILPGTENYWFDIYDHVTNTGEAVHFENWHEPTGRWYNTFASRIGGVGSRQVAVVFSDITERKTAEKELREREAWLSGQQRAFQAALSGKSLAESLDPIINTIIDQTGSEARAGIYVISQNADSLYLVAGMDEAYAKDVNGFRVGPESLSCGLTMYTGEPVITFDVEDDPLWQPYVAVARKHNYRSCWSFPILAEGGPVLGTLAFYYKEPRKPTSRETEMANILANAAAIIISRDNELKERTQAQAALQQSENRFRSFVAASSSLVYRMSADWQEMYALTGQDFLKDTERPNANWVETYIPPEDRKKVWTAITQAIEDKAMFEAEHRVITADGGIGWRASRAVPIIDETGQITEWIGTAVDITLRKQAEVAIQNFNQKLAGEVESRTAELEKSQALLQATLDSNQGMIQVFQAVRSQNGRIIDFIWVLNNEASEQVYGAVIGESLLKNNPGVVAAGIFDHFVQVTETGIPQQYEKRYIQEQFDGWFYQSAVKLNDGVATNTINITERKHAELLLQENRDRLQSIFDTTLVQMSILEAIRNDRGEIIDLVIKVVNKELEKETGRGDLVGKLYLEEYPGIKEVGLFDLIIKAIETGEPQATEYFYAYEGFNKWFSCMFVKLGDGVVATNMNITASKVAEEKLRKMEAEQQLEIFKVSLDALEEERHRISESLHNGVGQLLYGVKISLAGLKPGMSDEEFTQTKIYTDKLLSNAIKETRRVSHELMPLTLDEFGLKTAIEDIGRQLQDEVHFILQFKGLNGRFERYLELAVYRTVQELMTNIVKHANATKATVSITAEAKAIKIEVSDNGRGMKAVDSTKPGIGLSSIKSKIKLLNGEVNISSTDDKGTCVSIVIPMPG